MSFQATPHIFQSGKIRLLGGAIDSNVNKRTPQSIGHDLSRVSREAFTPRGKLNLIQFLDRENPGSIGRALRQQLEHKYVGSSIVIIPVESVAFYI